MLNNQRIKAKHGKVLDDQEEEEDGAGGGKNKHGGPQGASQESMD